MTHKALEILALQSSLQKKNQFSFGLSCINWKSAEGILAKGKSRGFPGGAVVESLPADAGDTGSGPGLGRSHMPRSDWAREPQLLSLRVWSLCPAAGGAAVEGGPRTAMRSGPRTAMGSGPRLAQLERALARTEDPIQTKIINK